MESSMVVRAFFGFGLGRGARGRKRESLLDLTVLTCQKRKAGVLLTKIGCLSGKADVARNKSRAFTEISKFAYCASGSGARQVKLSRSRIR